MRYNTGMPNGDYSVDRRSIYELLGEDCEYEVPPHHRRYAWDAEDAERLWKDMLCTASGEGSGEPKSNLLGSIVVIKDENSSRYEIVDGQQRLATMSLAFCAIRSHFLGFGEAREQGMMQEIADVVIRNIRRFLFVKAGRARVRLGESDRQLFEDIITSDSADCGRFCGDLRKKYRKGTGRLEKPHSLMIGNYRMLCDAAQEWVKKFGVEEAARKGDISGSMGAVFQLLDDIERIADSNHFVFVKAYDGRDAHKMFVTFNSLGQRLSQADLARLRASVPAVHS